MRKLILIINDGNKNEEIKHSLKEAYNILEFKELNGVMDMLAKTIPDLIIVNGCNIGEKVYENISLIKSINHNKYIPMIVVSDVEDELAEIKAFEMGVSDYIVKPIKKNAFKIRIDNLIKLSVHRNNLEVSIEANLEEFEKFQDVVIKYMAELVEVRDTTTGGHVKRTAGYVRVLVEGLIEKGSFENILTESYVRNLIRSAPLHDVGKLGILDSTLLKCGSLTEEEFEGMKQHTILGEKAINRMIKEVGGNEFLLMARDVASTHHEAWDGTGYPRGLKGEEIPLSGRIMAVADIYDALTTVRPYKAALSHKESVELIKRGRGNKLDPRVVDAFLHIEERFKEISDTNKVNGC